MRIVVVHHALDGGGSARAAVDLANHWARSGHDVVLPGLARDGDWHYPLDERITAVELTKNRPLERSAKIFATALPKLRRILNRSRPGAVVAIGALPNFAAMAATAGLRIPLVLSERADPSVMAGRRHSVFRNLGYRVQRARALVMQTEEAAAFVRQWVPADRVYVIPNPAPETAVARPPAGPGTNTVIAIGRLVPQKGFDMLLDAWSRIVSDRGEWRLRILGEGAMRSDLEALTKTLSIADSVEMPGFDPEPFRAMAHAELYAFSSRYEGFAHVLVEALACGLPVAAMDCPSGPRGIVRDGIDGFITPALDAGALAGSMSKLMDDAALREAMSRRAAEGADRFSPARIWAMWDDVLERATAR